MASIGDQIVVLALGVYEDDRRVGERGDRGEVLAVHAAGDGLTAYTVQLGSGVVTDLYEHEFIVPRS